MEILEEQSFAPQIDISQELAGLNEEQRQAVWAPFDKPLLILAGAGAGKTKVIVDRIAAAIASGIPAQAFLAITFTNKAAREMSERIREIIGPVGKDVRVGTFHSIATRLLRQFAPAIGFTKSFTIYDEKEQKALIEQIIKEQNKGLDAKLARAVQKAIGDLKNELIEPAKMTVSGSWQRQVQAVYAEYQKRLKQSNAMDFDDLLLNCVKLLQQNPDILERVRKRFQYLFIDEYQDTNYAQYVWARMVAAPANRITVVGDDAQSIYGWRGARVDLILRFEQDFAASDPTVVKLTKNYRSTQTILDAANQIIANNPDQYPKELVAVGEEGAKITSVIANSPYDEARFVVQRIVEAKVNGWRPLRENAILMRSSYLSRVVEEVLRQEGVPYVLKEIKFYDRAIIKTALAYARLVSNPADNLALRRVINEPKRGIGEETQNKIEAWASARDLTMWEALQRIEEIGVTKRALKPIGEFVAMIERWQQQLASATVADLFRWVLQEAGFEKALTESGTPEAQAGLENLQELIRDAQSFVQRFPTQGVTGFLERVTLIQNADQSGSEDAVVVSTVHAAKGLEWDAVYMIGMEEGIFPNGRAVNDGNIAEERRLAYVGVTRARKLLCLSRCAYRSGYGGFDYEESAPSRFLEEIDKRLLVEMNAGGASYGMTYRRPAARNSRVFNTGLIDVNRWQNMPDEDDLIDL